MEIKQTPRVTRPVEEVRRSSKLPWIILAIVVVVLILAGVLIYFYFIGRPSSTEEPTTNTATEETVEPETETQGGGLVNPDPDPEELIRLVQAQYNDPISNSAFDIFTGPIDIVGFDSSSSSLGSLDSEGLFSFETADDEETIKGLVSPNGQFIALLERNAQIISLVEIGGDSTEGVKIAEPDDADITDMVWSADSSGIIYGLVTEDFTSTTTQLVFFDIESNETQAYDREQEDADGKTMFPFAATNDELFVHITSNGSEDPGSVSAIEIGFGNELDGEAEKITELSIGQRGKVAVSDDGQLVAWAQGGQQELGSADEGPFSVELLDRSTGELTTLRESETEGYSSPLFTHDGSALIYGALSGIWRYDLDTGDRTQIGDLPALDVSQVPTPWSVRPDDEMVVYFETDNGIIGDTTIELRLIDAETELSEPLELTDGQDSLDSFFGWTTL